MVRLTFLLLLLLSVAPSADAEWYAEHQNKMGTRIEVQVWHDDADAARRLIADAIAEFDRIEAAMSTYRPNSEISAVNDRAAVEPVAVSPELFDLIGRSLELSVLTHGAFDITYDGVGKLYEFRSRTRPTGESISDSLNVIDYRYVRPDPAVSTIRFARMGVRINLGGIAKGYSVESVIGLLRTAGVRHAMAAAGGDTRLLGDRHGRPWMVGIRDPDDEKEIVTRLALQDEAISTSGDYERYFVEDEVRYHHIINPSTGRSAGQVRSATVIGPDATMTDGLSTSVFVMGPEKGLELIESLDGYEAVVIDLARRVHFSRGLDPR
jgi:thiamine biosynthesis lipoprotein